MQAILNRDVKVPGKAEYRFNKIVQKKLKGLVDGVSLLYLTIPEKTVNHMGMGRGIMGAQG